ncbi:MAG: transposase [Candidatus Desulforudis sp.]|nr:transposase [Desulforudis sp.]
MRFDPEKMLNIVIECHESDLSTEEVCRKHGIKVHTYYRWRRKLINAGLELLKNQLNYEDDRAGLIQEKNELSNKVKRLERDKALWELRYKWLWWHLESHKQPEIRTVVSHLKQQLASETDETAGRQLKRVGRI